MVLIDIVGGLLLGALSVLWSMEREKRRRRKHRFSIPLALLPTRIEMECLVDRVSFRRGKKISFTWDLPLGSIILSGPLLPAATWNLIEDDLWGWLLKPRPHQQSLEEEFFSRKKL